MASVLIPTILEKLPMWFLRIVEREKADPITDWTFNALSQAMARQLLIEESVQSNFPKQIGKKSSV